MSDSNNSNASSSMDGNEVEEFVAVDIAAIRKELSDSIAVEIERGFGLAEIHSNIAQQHIRVNGLINGDPLWSTLSDLAKIMLADERESGLAHAYYAAMTKKFRSKWMEANPLKAAVVEFDATVEAKAKIEAAGGRVITESDLAGPNGEQIIDEVAAEHGHDTREDECEMITGLRSFRAKLIAEGDAGANPDAPDTP